MLGYCFTSRIIIVVEFTINVYSMWYEHQHYFKKKIKFNVQSMRYS